MDTTCFSHLLVGGWNFLGWSFPISFYVSYLSFSKGYHIIVDDPPIPSLEMAIGQLSYHCAFEFSPY